MTTGKGEAIRLVEVKRFRHQLNMTYALGGQTYTTRYRYEDVDFFNLEDRHGADFMNKMYFHMLIFEATKLVNLAPDRVDLGTFSRWRTAPLESLWRQIVHHVWAQWRYQTQRPHYQAPLFWGPPAGPSIPPQQGTPAQPEILFLCGGGKDSLVAMKLLEGAGRDYASCAYSHDVYGAHPKQHQLIDGLLDQGRPRKRHRLWIEDSATHPAAPDETTPFITAETPCSLFAVLPVMLQHGYRYIVTGHERSANEGNLFWEESREWVNHQWGKSFEAESLLNRYFQEELIADVGYFSILQPIHDVLIFNMLRDHLDAVAFAHSCNHQKPWCRRCAKCAYVWLNYMAYLPRERVTAIFGANLFDIEANLVWYHQMLGLGVHTPFDCIGEVAEVRLAFELCRRKGLTGKAMDLYTRHFPQMEIPNLADYLRVAGRDHAIPHNLAPSVLSQMEDAARASEQYIHQLLKQTPATPG